MQEIDQALERISRLGGEELVGRMIAAFMENATKRVGDARQALGSGDRDGLGRAAHSLKSSAANVGAERLRALAREIEEGASGESPERLADLVGQLPATLDEVDRYLKGRAPSDEEDSGR